jgi:hypothetical protein
VIEANAPLIFAFPESVREDASAAISGLPESPHVFSAFSVQVAGESLSIPQRVCHDPLGISAGFRLGFRSKLAREILDCIFTRHTNGYVRQEYLRRIIHSKNIWIPPFVIQLAGEYVIEILRDIEGALTRLDVSIYGDFVRNNPTFVQQTKQRIVSYWDCYYRSIAAEKYPGFRILSFIEELERRPGERRA